MISLNKPVGQTPLQALDELRRRQPELASVKLSYAGRLDPMAEGLLLVLVGDENTNREKYLRLDKEYEVEILFGAETDTYDILGMLRQGDTHRESSLLAHRHRGKFADKLDSPLASAMQKLVGPLTLPYPPYSSKPVNGKPLFEWARSGKLDQIEIPEQDATIHSIEIIEYRDTKKEKLREYIFDSINKVRGDFRQEEIVEAWEKFFADTETPTEFNVAKIKVECTSGAYMRSIAHELGHALSISALALRIKRTKIGEYKI